MLESDLDIDALEVGISLLMNQASIFFFGLYLKNAARRASTKIAVGKGPWESTLRSFLQPFTAQQP
jgi:hypothetical protein